MSKMLKGLVKWAKGWKNEQSKNKEGAESAEGVISAESAEKMSKN